ncbi:MAG: flagellar motor protein MotB [Defluviitaleaceae bacterium]|nr:flagellar motor protein MotB [Defluviitaleaceae bacterium]
MARDKKTECPPGSPIWMGSYADMVTLILCFFVLMYSFAVLDASKFDGFAASFRRNTGESILDMTGGRGVTEMLGNGIIEFPVPRSAENLTEEYNEEHENRLRAYQQELASLFPSPYETYFDQFDGTPESFGGLLSLIVDPNDLTIEINIGNNYLFAPGDWRLYGNIGVLSDVAEVINRAFLPNDTIIIEGHTDNVPVRGGTHVRDNWDLSAARANSVRIELQRLTGLPGSAFQILGRGEEDPIESNDTPEGRAMNRRVVIYIKTSPLNDVNERFPEVNGQADNIYDTGSEISDGIVNEILDGILNELTDEYYFEIESIYYEEEQAMDQETGQESGPETGYAEPDPDETEPEAGPDNESENA